MAHWVAFAAFALLLTAGLVALTRASAGVVGGETEDLSPDELLLQTTLSQALVGALLVAALWVARIPADALGVAVSAELAAVGVAAGVALAAGNETAMHLLDAAGLGYDAELREALTPEHRRGWVVLFCVALPVVAGFEELLFRAVLVGALSTGFGASPWLFAAVSSVAFGAAHTAQGATGVVVTTLLGFALAAAYVLTGSLLVVFVAHYVVNAAEFALHAR
ncbi:CPBP family intramembrane glutamic endopeptidase [Halobacterium sp. CBA1126]|uniref:CPBP family intramembrane glutamic endopeptidase n=1 Tax=Halobacterium sp. CBA1126 TaxID=2668074 RepID=UPI0012FA0C7D|nr:CPBP family intramembrane glutamic endopeptidase [Halobacterium sp. CBA1126]MUV60546.1 CPBP family intramembrane metalloprotease [Halobacterium sp. CBA1126]